MPQFSSDHVFSAKYLASFSVLLWGVLVALNANAGFDQDRMANALAWSVQVPSAFLALAGAWHVLSRWRCTAQWQSLWRIGTSAVAASLIMCPWFWGIENGVALLLERPWPDPWPGSAQALASVLWGEWLHMVLPFVGVWLLVALPVLHRISPVQLSPLATDAATPDASSWLPQGEEADQTEQASPKPHAVEEGKPDKRQLAQAQALPLPADIQGDWLLAQSELQYVRVWTTRGNALVLGSLTHIEQFYGASGLRVHKSWWGACAAVHGVDKRADKTLLNISNGLQVPVSRRKQQAVLDALRA